MCGSFQYLPRPTIVVHAYALAVWSVPIILYYVGDQWGSRWLYWLSLIMCVRIFIDFLFSSFHTNIFTS